MAEDKADATFSSLRFVSNSTVPLIFLLVSALSLSPVVYDPSFSIMTPTAMSALSSFSLFSTTSCIFLSS